jgi:hypothetical protein
MEKDFRDILLALNHANAKYLVVGGYAVSIHAQPRATKDLDLWIETTAENSVAVFRALAAYGAPLGGLTAEDFHRLAKTGFQIGVAPYRIDILHEIDGLTFAEAWESRVETVMDDDIPVHLIGREELVRNKMISGRPQDLADVAAIRKAEAARAKKKGS